MQRRSEVRRPARAVVIRSERSLRDTLRFDVEAVRAARAEPESSQVVRLSLEDRHAARLLSRRIETEA